MAIDHRRNDGLEGWGDAIVDECGHCGGAHSPEQVGRGRTTPAIEAAGHGVGRGWGTVMGDLRTGLSEVGKGHTVFRDLTGHILKPITTNGDRWAEWTSAAPADRCRCESKRRGWWRGRSITSEAPGLLSVSIDPESIRK